MCSHIFILRIILLCPCLNHVLSWIIICTLFTHTVSQISTYAHFSHIIWSHKHMCSHIFILHRILYPCLKKYIYTFCIPQFTTYLSIDFRTQSRTTKVLFLAHNKEKPTSQSLQSDIQMDKIPCLK